MAKRLPLLALLPAFALVFAYAFVSAPTPVTTDPTDYNITNSPSAGDTVAVVEVHLGIQSTGTISSSGNSYSAANPVLALGSSLNGWILGSAAGGSTTHNIVDVGGTASVIVAPIFSGASATIQHTPTGASNASITGAPFTGVTITSTAAALMIGCLATTASPTVTSSGATSETNMSGNDGVVFLNCAHRRATGAGSYNFTWTFAGSQATFDIGWAISESGAAPATKNPAHLNSPVRGSGLFNLLKRVFGA